jgi:hypothetical protein
VVLLAGSTEEAIAMSISATAQALESVVRTD